MKPLPYVPPSAEETAAVRAAIEAHKARANALDIAHLAAAAPRPANDPSAARHQPEQPQ